MREERMDAYEIGYVGTLPNNLTLTVNVYRNRERDSADFYPATFYTSSNPPPRWPLPPQALDFPPLRNALPSSFTYRNVGEIINQGVELGLNGRHSPQWSWFFNYTYQEDPEVSGVDVTEVTHLPPNHRVNAGAGYDPGDWFVNANVNYQDEAFWTDVLDARFWGPTESFTAVNATAGVRLNRQRTTISIIGTNLTDERIQQHVFGDIIGRKILAQVQFRY
jgi:outer membrane receptor protein involved in Fe transport